MRLLRPVYARLSQYVYAMVADDEEAREILSDTSLTAYEQFETLKKPDSFLFFPFTIARRKYKRGLWRRKIFIRYDHSVHDMTEASDVTPDARADMRLLHEALAKLPSKQREAVTLFELSDLPLEEIASIQNAKLSTVKQRLRVGRMKLAELLGVTTTTDADTHMRNSIQTIIDGLVQPEED